MANKLPGGLPASGMNTLTVRAVTTDTGATNRNPTLLYKATNVPMRIVVRNMSPMGLVANLAYDNTTLQPGDFNAQNAYQLPSGASDVFVLLPGEQLYAASPNTFDCILSIAWSVAFPFDVKA